MKKLVVLLYLLSFSSAYAQEMKLIPYRVGDKYGFSDYYGTIKVAPRFDSVAFFTTYAHTFPTTYAQVFNKVDGKLKGSLVDNKDHQYMPFLFDRVELIQAHGIAEFFSNSMYTILSRSASLQWLSQADSLIKQSVEQEERANHCLLVHDKNQVTVYDTVKQKTVLPGFYNYVIFTGTINKTNYYVVQVDDPAGNYPRYGLVNDQGVTCLPTEYIGIGQMDLSLMPAGPSIQSQKQLTDLALMLKKLYFYVYTTDLQGNVHLYNIDKKTRITKKPYYKILFFGKNEQGLFLFKTEQVVNDQRKIGLIDETGKVIHENKYVDIVWEILPNKKNVIKTVSEIPEEHYETSQEGLAEENYAEGDMIVANPAPPVKSPEKKQEVPKPAEPEIFCRKNRCGLQVGKALLLKAEYDSIQPYQVDKYQPIKHYIAYKKGLGYLYLVELRKLVDIPFTRVLSKSYSIDFMKREYVFFLQNKTDVTVIKNNTGLADHTFSNVTRINTNYLGKNLLISPNRYCFYDPIGPVVNCFETDSIYEVQLGASIVCRKNGNFTVVNYQDKPLTAFSQKNPFQVIQLERGVFAEIWDKKNKKLIVYKKDKTISVPFSSYDPILIPTDSYRRQGIYRFWDDRKKVYYLSKEGVLFYEPQP